jgi:hypothetical protein
MKLGGIINIICYINRTDKAHAMLVRPHNRCHHKGKLIDYISCRYYNTMYNTTYSDVSFGRFTNALSLTNDIGLLFRYHTRNKYVLQHTMLHTCKYSSHREYISQKV